MSKQVDERVVSMEFDNSNFEKNVSQSMSTLEKFKQSLKFSGATKGLEDINAAAGNVNMGGLGGAVESVKSKFSALEIVGVTALVNITNKAINAGEQLVKSLTIDNVAAGWQKFADKTTSVATLVAQGNALEDVNDQLDRLNWFTDETSYNFTDMVSNIAKFTATGQGLNESVTAMEGIATWAALSGQNATTASRAMYQLSQALGSGYMRLEDYKSIQNASMDTEEFRQKTLDAAVALGTLKDNGDGTYTSLVEGASDTSFTISQFARNLTDGMWFTSDVMMDVFNTYSAAVDGIYEAAEEKGMLASEIIDEIYETAEKKSISVDEAIQELGYGFDSFALKAFEAAQKARTFKDAIDSVKDALSTAWMNIFELIFGDAEQATELWTDLANTLYDVFVEPVNSISELLEGTLGKSFEGIKDVIDGVTEPIDNVIRTLEDYNRVVDEVIRGEWGITQVRWDALTEAGYDWISVQNLVNAELGVAKHRQTDYVIGQDEMTKSTEEATDSNTKYIAKLAEMSEAELRALGLTEEQISGLKELKKQADKLGLSVEYFIDNIDKIDGRWVLINTFKNAWAGLVKVFEAVKTAWQEVFPPKTIEERSEKLYDIIAAIHKFSTKLIMSDDTAKKLTRTFKGLFAIVSMVKTVVGGGFSVAFKILSQILSYFDLDILDVTAAIGDAIVAFKDWFDSIFDISWILDIVAPILEATIGTITRWFRAFKESEGLKAVVEYIKELASNVKEWWASLKDSENVPKAIAEGIIKAFSSIPKIISTIFSNLWKAITGSFAGADNGIFSGIFDKISNGLKIAGQTVVELGKLLLEKLNNFISKNAFKEISFDAISGLVEGLKDGASNAWQAAVEMAKNLVQKVKDFLGIHSPSKVFIAIGGFIVAGLVLGLQNGGSEVLSSIKGVLQPAIDWIKDIDFGSIISAASVATTAVSFYKLSDALQSFASPLKGLRDIFESAAYVMKKSAKSISKVIKGFANIMNAVAFDIKADAIKTLATSLLMLVGAVIILTFFDTKELWKAVGMVTVLALILVGLAAAMSLINKSALDIDKNSISVKSLGSGLISISFAIMLMAMAVKMLGKLDADQAKQGFLALAGCVAAIAVVVAAFGLLVKGKASANIDKFGKTMTKLAIALLLMAVVVKTLGKMDIGVLKQGIVAIAAFGAIIVGLMAATKLISGSKNVEKIGSTLLKIAAAIGIMAIVAKVVGGMDQSELTQGTIAIVAFAGIMVGLMYATKLINGCKNVDTIGGTLLKISVAIGLMALVARLLGGMDPAKLAKGGLAIIAFGGIITGLMYVTKLVSGSKNVAKIGTSILAVSGAIAIMAGIAILLSFVSWESFAKGAVMIAAFGGIIVGLMAATKLISGSKNVDKIGKTLLMVSGAIAILAGVAILLGLVPIENLAKGTIVVAIMSGLVMGLIAVTKKAKDCMKELIVLTAMIAIMAGAIYLIANLDTDKALSSTLALGGLMVAMTIVLKQLKNIAKDWKDALIGIGLLSAMIVPLVLFIWALSLMDGIDTSIDTVISLSVLMAAMTGLLAIMSKLKFGWDALKGIGLLTLMVIPLAAFAFVLANMSGIDNAIENAIALSLLATACTLLMIPLVAIGALMTTGVGMVAIGAGILALASVVAALFLIVGVLWAMSGIKNAETNAKLLTDLLTVLTDTLIKLAVVGPLALIGVSAMTGLTVLIGVIGVFATAVGKLMDLCPELENFLDKGISVLIKIAEGIGEMIGAFIGSIGERLGDSLVKIGEDIAEFIETIAEASKTAGTIKGESFDGIEKLMGVLLKIGGTSIATGFMDKLSMIFNFGDDSMEAFEKNGVAFFKAMKTIGEASAEVSINNDAFGAVIEAAESLVKLQNSIEPIGGVIDWFTGRDDLGTFGVNAAAFIFSMKIALSSLEDAEFNTDAMDEIITAATSMAELQKSIEPIGGVIKFFTGRDDLGTFGLSAASFITSMKIALSTLDGVSFNMEAIDQLITSSERLGDLQGSLEKIGGVIAFFVGTDDLGTFGLSAATFIASMKIALSTLDGVSFNIDAIDQLITSSERLGDLQGSLEKIGGVIDFFAGSDDLGTFGLNAASFIASMKIALGTLDGASFNMEAIEQLITSSERLGDLQGSLEKIGGVIAFFVGTDDLATFGLSAASFITSMKIALGTLDGVSFNMEAIDQLITSSERLGDLQGSLEKIGGVIAFFVGTDDLATFGLSAASFITSMKIAFGTLDGVTFNVDAISQLITAATEMAKIQSSLDRIGGIVSWFAGRSDLATFGKKASDFVTSMKTAFSQLNDVTEFNTAAMDAIIEAAIGLADIANCTSGLDGVMSWFSGKDGFVSFGEKVNDFVGAMKEAYSQLDDTAFNTEAMKLIIEAANALASLEANLEPIGGVISWFKGQSDLATFGTRISQFAEAMGKLREGMGENGISEAVIASITNSGNAIIELQKALPKEGIFDGKMNLSEFSDYITDFAEAMSTFGSKASEIDSNAVSTVISTAYRVKSLIESLVGLDTSGVKAFTGIGTGGIGADGPAYKIAKAMAAYSDEVAGIDTNAVSVSASAARTLRNLIAGLVNLDSSGVENFKPDAIGTKMKSYADKVSGIDTTVVSSSISAANRLRSFISSLAGLDSSGVANFKPESIGTAIKNYAGSISGINTQVISNSIGAAIRLRNFITSLAGIDTSGVASFKKAVDDLSTVNVTGMIRTFSNASTTLASSGAKMIESLSDGMNSKKAAVEKVATGIASTTIDKIESKISGFTKAGKSMATSLADGLESGKKGVESAGSALADAAKDAIRDKYDSFYDAGSYLVIGFKNGISENSYTAAAKAKAMAEAAVEAARKALKINSPSKVFKEIGSGIPEGFAMGIGMLGSSVDDSVDAMASTAINSARSAMATVLDALNSDMDAQPTIRPVIDLSEVKTGVNAIGGLFSGTQNIGVQSNLSAINVAMNRRLQNGANDDVVSAINKLNAGLEGSRGDTYNFAGITYDNGDEISEAVQTLVRAAKMGRRV